MSVPERKVFLLLLVSFVSLLIPIVYALSLCFAVSRQAWELSAISSIPDPKNLLPALLIFGIITGYKGLRIMRDDEDPRRKHAENLKALNSKPKVFYTF